ncbi:Lipase (class 3) [Asimina triloba]
MVDDGLVKKSCCLSFKAASPFLLWDKDASSNHSSSSSSSSLVFFAFPSVWSVEDWKPSTPNLSSSEFLSIFPSLCRVSSTRSALLHSPFLNRFLTLLSNSLLQQQAKLYRAVESALVDDGVSIFTSEDVILKPCKKYLFADIIKRSMSYCFSVTAGLLLGKFGSLNFQVRQAMAKRKQIVMTGHSSGGSVAVIATIWLLEQFRKLTDQSQLPLCITFGSPLVGDSIFAHALRREDWSSRFIHFVMRYDIIPRVLLVPFEAIECELQTILPFLNPKLPYSGLEAVGRSQAVSLFGNVIRNASLLASQRACLSMDCTNMLLEALPSFVKLSPFRPVGTYIFCTGNGRLLIVNNSDAVLQLLSYCLQLGPEQDMAEVAFRSLKEHLAYESELQESLAMQDIVSLDQLDKVPLSLEDARSNETLSVETTLNDLGLGGIMGWSGLLLA